MASSTPINSNELIDCARANAGEEIEVVAQRCGYGSDIETFERELKKACHSIGIDITTFKDLARDEPEQEKELGIEIAPETPTKF